MDVQSMEEVLPLKVKAKKDVMEQLSTAKHVPRIALICGPTAIRSEVEAPIKSYLGDYICIYWHKTPMDDPSRITSAFKFLTSTKKYDAVGIVSGVEQELYLMNDVALIDVVANSPVPTIIAIGEHDNPCELEEVADFVVSTSSNLGATLFKVCLARNKENFKQKIVGSFVPKDEKQKPKFLLWPFLWSQFIWICILYLDHGWFWSNTKEPVLWVWKLIYQILK